MSYEYTRTYIDFDVKHQQVVKHNGNTISTRLISRDAFGTRSGSRVKDWKEKIRTGQQASSEYYLDRYKLQAWEPASIYYSWKATFSPFNVTIGSFDGSLSNCEPIRPNHLSTSNAVEAIALSKIYKKIQSEQQHLNSPAVIAEFLDVVRQFGRPAEALVDLTNRRFNRLELERRGLKGTVAFKRIKWEKVLASTYLEWSFGLAPLIQDTATIAEAFARFKDEESGLVKPRSKIQSRASEERSTYVTNGSETATGSNLRFLSVIRTKTQKRCQYTVGLDTTQLADFGSNDRLLQLLGLDRSNWITAAWEAVPWSWLIDYFSNVQQILDAAATATTDVKWINKTVVERTTCERTSVFLPKETAQLLAPNYKLLDTMFQHKSRYPHCGKSTVLRTTMTRTLPVSLGVPPLTLEYPTGAKRLANMVSVLFARGERLNSALWLK